MKKILQFSLTTIIILLFGGWLSRAQTDSLRTVTQTCPVYFPEGSAEYIPKDDIKSFLDTINVPSILRIGINAYASPVGSTDANLTLSVLRAKAVGDSLSVKFPSIPVTATGYGEDWTGLARMLMDDGRYDEALSVILNTPRFIKDSKGNIVDGRKRRLMNMDGGNTWKTLRKDFFPMLQRADILFTCSVPDLTIHIVDTTATVTAEPPCALPSEQDRNADPAHPSASDSSAVSDIWAVSVMESPILTNPSAEPTEVPNNSVQDRIIGFAPRTNLLVPAMNIGVVVPISKRLSVEADFYSPWLGFDKDNRHCFQLQGADAELRWWINPRPAGGVTGNTLTGHSLALLAFGGHYDIERHFHGEQGEVYGGALEYGWAFPVFKTCRMQLSVAFGYALIPYRTYTVYVPGGKLLEDDAYIHHTRQWVGPVKAGVEFIVPIYVHTKKRRYP